MYPLSLMSLMNLPKIFSGIHRALESKFSASQAATTNYPFLAETIARFRKLRKDLKVFLFSFGIWAPLKLDP